jgi:hypothetical protein
VSLPASLVSDPLQDVVAVTAAISSPLISRAGPRLAISRLKQILQNIPHTTRSADIPKIAAPQRTPS